MFRRPALYVTSALISSCALSFALGQNQNPNQNQTGTGSNTQAVPPGLRRGQQFEQDRSVRDRAGDVGRGVRDRAADIGRGVRERAGDFGGVQPSGTQQANDNTADDNNNDGNNNQQAVDLHIVAILSAENQAEITISRLAQRHATNAQVRTFAEAMVREHAEFQAQLQASAGTSDDDSNTRRGDDSNTRRGDDSNTGTGDDSIDPPFVPHNRNQRGRSGDTRQPNQQRNPSGAGQDRSRGNRGSRSGAAGDAGNPGDNSSTAPTVRSLQALAQVRSRDDQPRQQGQNRTSQRQPSQQAQQDRQPREAPLVTPGIDADQGTRVRSGIRSEANTQTRGRGFMPAENNRTGTRTSAAASGNASLGIMADVYQQQLAIAQEQLQNAEGDQFDRAYMNHQVFFHAHMIGTLRAVRGHASVELRQVIDQAESREQEHLDQARSILQSLFADSNETTEGDSNSDTGRQPPFVPTQRDRRRGQTR